MQRHHCVGNLCSKPVTLNTGAPQGCVLSSLFYSLFTRDCVSTQSTNTIVKCTDDTTVVGLISNSETACREEVEHPEHWSNDKTPALNSKKTGDLGLQTATPGRASSISTRGLSRSCQGPPTHLQRPKRPPLPSDAEEDSATATTADQQALHSAPLLSV